ncbi:hypothetical protein TNCT_385811 [Trichonephila clavata]|uniref:Uncharacterized protein n=1 Tax=Trichonephila clavata TaxID=2740835 RepID=A0A8X6J338_TRICU|nr:hypothetical protein TNCT_385811 [Trichonephila clavata]
MVYLKFFLYKIENIIIFPLLVSCGYREVIAMEEIYQQLAAICRYGDNVLKNICGPQYSDELKRFSTKHPLVFTGVVSIGMFSAFPLLCFLGFTFMTLFVALLFFLCIEGSIIAIAGLIFVGIVSFIAIIVAACVSALGVGFWILGKLRSILRKATQKHSTEVSKSNQSSAEKVSKNDQPSVEKVPKK